MRTFMTVLLSKSPFHTKYPLPMGVGDCVLTQFGVLATSFLAFFIFFGYFLLLFGRFGVNPIGAETQQCRHVRAVLNISTRFNKLLT